MADGRFIADTLQTVIVGLADSITEAQEQLSQAPPLDSFGRPNAQYRIPYLDFEIGFKLVTQTSQDGARSFLFFRPTGSSSSTDEVTSKISGRFVAIPPGEGLPLPVLTLTASGTGATRRLTVDAANNTGEVLAGATIQLNVDLATSQAMSVAAGVTDPRITGNVTLGSAVLSTDQTGQASTEVRFGDQLRVGAVVLITAELGPSVARITTGKSV